MMPSFNYLQFSSMLFCLFYAYTLAVNSIIQINLVHHMSAAFTRINLLWHFNCLSYWKQLQDVAFLLLKESRELEKNPVASKGSHVPQVRLIEQAYRLFVETKEHPFESKSSEEHAKLLRYLRMWYDTEFVMWGYYCFFPDIQMKNWQ